MFPSVFRQLEPRSSLGLMKWREKWQESTSPNPSLTVSKILLQQKFSVLCYFRGFRISFFNHIFIVAGDIVIQEFLLGEDGTLQVMATIFNPVDPGDVPDVAQFACDIGSGVTFTAPAYNR